MRGKPSGVRLLSSSDESEVTILEWADLNEVSEELWEYDKLSEARSISDWDSKSPSLEDWVLSIASFAMVKGGGR
ncbi:uncharacterized protein G2W53_010434 [Senna tora]|uniref:Uncharacterized protein n=1 Tax=Senna tora TaxID=362788 RepID=A0A835CBL1_9FABA|nr:uncharacterized protein G2W53_010434 [Senna tora]